MSPSILGHGPNNYPHHWHKPPKPWPKEPEDALPEPQFVKAAQKAQQIRNQIMQLQKLVAKAEAKK